MKYADYISRIEIDQLWSGRRHIVWELDKSVNILSGVNGVGKSTILHKVINSLGAKGELSTNTPLGVKLDVVPEDATHVKFDVIRSFDRPLVNMEMAQRLDFQLGSELDLQIFNLQRRYLDYQVNLGNRIISCMQNPTEENMKEAQRLSKVKQDFHDMIDRLFAETGKKVVRTENEIRFEQMGEILTPYKLSSGEKQMLIILLTVLAEDQQPCVLLMDEPEVSLHIDWQEQLICLIKQLNPNVQIILTTHSPAVIMNGWTDSVTLVEDIVS